MSTFGFSTFDQNSAKNGTTSPQTAGPLTPATATEWAFESNFSNGSYQDCTGFIQIYNTGGNVIGLQPLSNTSPVSISNTVPGGGWITNLLLFKGPSYPITCTLNSVQVASNVCTITTSAQHFILGTQIQFPSGLNSAFLNGQLVKILSNTGTSITFAFTHADVGPTSETSGITNFPYLQMADAAAATSDTGGTTNAVTLPNNVSPGSTILVFLAHGDVNTFCTIASVADGTNSYSVSNIQGTGGGSDPGSFANFAWATNSASGSLTVTTTSGTYHNPSGGGRYIVMELPPVPPPTLVSIAVTPANASMTPSEETKQYTATGTYSDSSTADVTSSATWSSSDTAVATIVSGGLATRVAAGMTTIEAAIGAINGSTSLTVDALTVTSVAITPTNAAINTGGGTQQYAAMAIYSDSSTADVTSSSTWLSSNSSVATINSSGLATSGLTGVVTITAIFSGVTSNPATLEVGRAITLSGSFQYANTARVANGFVSFALRECHAADSAELFADGDPILTQLNSNGAFTVVLETFDDLVKPTPYRMIVYDAQQNFLMERNVYFFGTGSATLAVPNQEDGTAFVPQYPSDTGYRLIEGGFGSSAANGSVTFKLYQQAMTTAGVQIVPTPLTYQLDESGNLPAGVYLYLQAELSPFTLYLVTVHDSQGNLLSKAMYSLSETSPAVCNLNNLTDSIDTTRGPDANTPITYSNVPGVFWAAIKWLKS